MRNKKISLINCSLCLRMKYCPVRFHHWQMIMIILAKAKIIFLGNKNNKDTVWGNTLNNNKNSENTEYYSGYLIFFKKNDI